MKSAELRVASLIWIASSAIAGGTAKAAILSINHMGHGCEATYQSNTGPLTTTESVTPTSIPFNQSITADDGHGGVITANYNLTDNGAQAIIQITTSGSASSRNDIVEGNGNDLFSILEPVFITIAVNPGSYGVGDSIVFSSGIYVNDFQSSPYLYSGFTTAGSMTVEEEWYISNGNVNTTTQSGSGSFTITLTAIPEPSSVGLAIGSAAAVLLRRRRQGEKLQ